MSDVKKRINMVDIEEPTHEWLVQQANIMGMSIKDYAGYLIDDARLKKWKKPSKDEPERLALWNYHQALIAERKKDIAYKMAAMYECDKTEEMADLLARQCELAGLDYSEVIRQVQDDPYSSLVAFSHNGTKLGECIRWLGNVLKGKKVGLPASAVFSMAHDKGYSQTMLNRAKRAMNADINSPKVLSVRKANGWFWQLKERSQEIV